MSKCIVHTSVVSHVINRSASKDLGLEAEYARLLKDSSIHEKAIMRDLGR